jgi:hypothetical protein
MCIILFHARDGYLQTYDTLLKEINVHPGSEQVPTDQYEVECSALADHNFNVPCKTEIRYPSLIDMINHQDILWKPTVIFNNVPVYTVLYCELSMSY